MVAHVFRYWAETRSVTELPADSALRAEGFLPVIFKKKSLKEQLTKRLSRFFDQRYLRMLKRLGIRSKAKKEAYHLAGGPKLEVKLIYNIFNVTYIIVFFPFTSKQIFLFLYKYSNSILTIVCINLWFMFFSFIIESKYSHSRLTNVCINLWLYINTIISLDIHICHVHIYYPQQELADEFRKYQKDFGWDKAASYYDDDESPKNDTIKASKRKAKDSAGHGKESQKGAKKPQVCMIYLIRPP